MKDTMNQFLKDEHHRKPLRGAEKYHLRSSDAIKFLANYIAQSDGGFSMIAAHVKIFAASDMEKYTRKGKSSKAGEDMEVLEKLKEDLIK